MIAQDLPNKPRYPIFSAVASLCHTLNAEETSDDLNAEGTEVRPAKNITAGPSSAPPINTTIQTYLDGSARFVDLEANVPGNNSISDSSSSARKRRREKRKARAAREHLDYVSSELPFSGATLNPGTEKSVITLNAYAPQGEVSNLRNESTTDAYGAQSDTFNKNNSEKSLYSSSSNHSYATAGWYELKPSDDSDVVYSLCSEEENITNNSTGKYTLHK